MDVIRDAIVATLKAKFPSMEQGIKPFTGLLDERKESQIVYPAPGLIVCAISIQEAPDTVAPWELRCNLGIVVTVKNPRAIERDTEGWQLAIKAANVVYRNTWGISQMNIRPAVIVGIQKNEQIRPDGTPTGVNYWTILFYNWIKFEALLRD